MRARPFAPDVAELLLELRGGGPRLSLRLAHRQILGLDVVPRPAAALLHLAHEVGRAHGGLESDTGHSSI